MRKQTLITALLLTTVMASGAFAKQIYKWTAEDGSVHYADVPMASEAERVAISSKPTDQARVQAQTQARVDASNQRAEAAAEAAAAGPSAEELKAKADERAQQCSQYRQTLQKFVVSRRLYKEDEAGERVYLDEAETQAARDRVEGQVEEFCT